MLAGEASVSSGQERQLEVALKLYLWTEELHREVKGCPIPKGELTSVMFNNVKIWGRLLFEKHPKAFRVTDRDIAFAKFTETRGNDETHNKEDLEKLYGATAAEMGGGMKEITYAEGTEPVDGSKGMLFCTELVDAQEAARQQKIQELTRLEKSGQACSYEEVGTGPRSYLTRMRSSASVSSGATAPVQTEGVKAEPVAIEATATAAPPQLTPEKRGRGRPPKSRIAMLAAARDGFEDPTPIKSEGVISTPLSQGKPSSANSAHKGTKQKALKPLPSTLSGTFVTLQLKEILGLVEKAESDLKLLPIANGTKHLNASAVTDLREKLIQHTDFQRDEVFNSGKEDPAFPGPEIQKRAMECVTKMEPMVILVEFVNPPKGKPESAEHHRCALALGLACMNSMTVSSDLISEGVSKSVRAVYEAGRDRELYRKLLTYDLDETERASLLKGTGETGDTKLFVAMANLPDHGGVRAAAQAKIIEKELIYVLGHGSADPAKQDEKVVKEKSLNAFKWIEQLKGAEVRDNIIAELVEAVWAVTSPTAGGIADKSNLDKKLKLIRKRGGPLERLLKGAGCSMLVTALKEKDIMLASMANDDRFLPKLEEAKKRADDPEMKKVLETIGEVRPSDLESQEVLVEMAAKWKDTHETFIKLSSCSVPFKLRYAEDLEKIAAPLRELGARLLLRPAWYFEDTLKLASRAITPKPMPKDELNGILDQLKLAQEQPEASTFGLDLVASNDSLKMYAAVADARQKLLIAIEKIINLIQNESPDLVSRQVVPSLPHIVCYVKGSPAVPFEALVPEATEIDRRLHEVVKKVGEKMKTSLTLEWKDKIKTYNLTALIQVLDTVTKEKYEFTGKEFTTITGDLAPKVKESEMAQCFAWADVLCNSIQPFLQLAMQPYTDLRSANDTEWQESIDSTTVAFALKQLGITRTGSGQVDLQILCTTFQLSRVLRTYNLVKDCDHRTFAKMAFSRKHLTDLDEVVPKLGSQLSRYYDNPRYVTELTKVFQDFTLEARKDFVKSLHMLRSSFIDEVWKFASNDIIQKMEDSGWTEDVFSSGKHKEIVDLLEREDYTKLFRLYNSFRGENARYVSLMDTFDSKDKEGTDLDKISLEYDDLHSEDGILQGLTDKEKSRMHQVWLTMGSCVAADALYGEKDATDTYTQRAADALKYFEDFGIEGPRSLMTLLKTIAPARSPFQALKLPPPEIPPSTTHPAAPAAKKRRTDGKGPETAEVEAKPPAAKKQRRDSTATAKATCNKTHDLTPKSCSPVRLAVRGT